MATDKDLFKETLCRALSGKNAHAQTAGILEGLDWKLAAAQPPGVPHTVFQLANHMIYWAEWAAKWLDGKRPRVPKHAAGGWPGGVGPGNRKEWERTVRRFRKMLSDLDGRSRDADLLARRGKMTRLEMLHSIASHNSYHAGQVAFLRKSLGAWPPPSGGVTW